MLAQGSNTFYTHALLGKRGIPIIHAHITLMNMLALYGSTVVCTSLHLSLIFRPDKAMNLVLLYEDIWTSFFSCLVCRLLKNARSLDLGTRVTPIKVEGIRRIWLNNYMLQIEWHGLQSVTNSAFCCSS